MSQTSPYDAYAANGGVGSVIRRVGKTVVRKSGPWTPAVHELLGYLEAAGFKYSPRVLGFDDAGNEILSHIAGVGGRATWSRVSDETGLRAFARLLRAYHEAVADFHPSVSAQWALTAAELGPGEIICHGDFGPWNTIWRGRVPVGIIDFDFAGPRPRLYDVAYALEYSAPFRDDIEARRWLAYSTPPDRAHRLAVFARAYGLPEAQSTNKDLYAAVLAVQKTGIADVRELATQGREPQRQWVAAGHVLELAQRVAWTRAHRHLFVQ